MYLLTSVQYYDVFYSLSYCLYIYRFTIAVHTQWLTVAIFAYLYHVTASIANTR